jgi:hypothetical protein
VSASRGGIWDPFEMRLHHPSAVSSQRARKDDIQIEAAEWHVKK